MYNRYSSGIPVQRRMYTVCRCVFGHVAPAIARRYIFPSVNKLFIEMRGGACGETVSQTGHWDRATYASF